MPPIILLLLLLCIILFLSLFLLFLPLFLFLLLFLVLLLRLLSLTSPTLDVRPSVAQMTQKSGKIASHIK